MILLTNILSLANFFSNSNLLTNMSFMNFFFTILDPNIKTTPNQLKAYDSPKKGGNAKGFGVLVFGSNDEKERKHETWRWR